MQPVPQPVKAVLALRRIRIAAIADATGKSVTYASRVLNGWQAPSAEFRSGVAAFLGLPEEELFRPAAAWLEVVPVAEWVAAGGSDA